jgi:hypothetical protein
LFITFLERVIYDFLDFVDASVEIEWLRKLFLSEIESEIKFPNLIESVLFDFRLSRHRSTAIVAASIGFRRFDDIRRRNLLKLILLVVLVSETSDKRSESLSFVVVAAGFVV